MLFAVSLINGKCLIYQKHMAGNVAVGNPWRFCFDWSCEFGIERERDRQAVWKKKNIRPNAYVGVMLHRFSCGECNCINFRS